MAIVVRDTPSSTDTSDPSAATAPPMATIVTIAGPPPASATSVNGAADVAIRSGPRTARAVQATTA